MKIQQGVRQIRAMRTPCLVLLSYACVASACAAGAVGSSPTLRQGRAGTVLQGQHVMKGTRAMALRGGAPLDEVRWVDAFTGVCVCGRAGGRACMYARFFVCAPSHDPNVMYAESVVS